MITDYKTIAISFYTLTEIEKLPHLTPFCLLLCKKHLLGIENKFYTVHNAIFTFNFLSEMYKDKFHKVKQALFSCAKVCFCIFLRFYVCKNATLL